MTKLWTGLLAGLLAGCNTPSLVDGSIPEPPVRPGPPEEVCDGEDNDLDGAVDEGFSDADGDGRADCVDPPPCDGLLERDEPVAVGVDESCYGDPFELLLEEFFEVQAGGGLAFGPIEDTDGDGAYGSGDEHAFVFVSRPFGVEDPWTAGVDRPPGALRVVSAARDETRALSLSRDASFAVAREAGDLHVFGYTPETVLSSQLPNPTWTTQFGSWDLDGATAWLDPALSTTIALWGFGEVGFGANWMTLRRGATAEADVLIQRGWALRTNGEYQPCPNRPLWDMALDSLPPASAGPGYVGGDTGKFFNRSHPDSDRDGVLDWSLGRDGWVRGCDLESPPPNWSSISPWFQFPTPPWDPENWPGTFGELFQLAAVQLDTDQELEGIWWADVDGLSTSVTPSTLYLLAIDDDGTLLWTRPVRAEPFVDAPLCDDPRPQPIVADFDGDPFSEVAIQWTCPEFDSVATRMLDDDGRDLWANAVQPGDVSGYGPAAFDFDGDGDLDLVQHLGDELVLTDGQTGAQLGSVAARVPSPAALASMGRFSSNRFVGSTIRLLVLDVDGDGSAEIVVPQVQLPDGRIGIGVYGHGDGAFPGASRVVAHDGLPPTCLSDSWELVACDDWVDAGVPSDGNVAIGPALDLPRSKLEIEVVDRCGQCAADGSRAAALSLAVRNRGVRDWEDPIELTATMAASGELVGIVTIPGPIPSGLSSPTVRLDLDPQAIDADLRLEMDVPLDDRRLCAPPAPVLFPGPGCEW